MDSKSLGTSEIPEVNLHVQLSQQWPGCNSLLIDVVPDWLIMNEAGIPVIVTEGPGQEWDIPIGTSLAPPLFQVIFGNTCLVF